MPKCTNNGCGKEFTEPEEPCLHHPGAPIFHEGQKGWQCCKPRVLTFDEFLSIPPCTTGKHSTEAQPQITNAPRQPAAQIAASTVNKDGVETYRTTTPLTALPTPAPTPVNREKPVPKEKPVAQDDPAIPVLEGAKCKRLGCSVVYKGPETYDSKCVHHPGVPIFHEGSKGYTCCKRKVLEFDQFLKIEGCQEDRHLFVGAQKPKEEEELVDCRNDFYQTYTDVIVSIFARKVNKDQAKVEFLPNQLNVDFPTQDNKRYKMSFPLYAAINPEGSTYKVLGTKVELKLKKADGTSWPVLRSDEATGEIIQIGQPGRM